MEFRLDEILTVIDKVKSTDLAMFEYQDADTRICIKGTKKNGPVRHGAGRKAACAQEAAGADSGESLSAAVSTDKESAAEPVDAAQDGYLVTSPMVGTFYAAPAEKEAPFVRVGDKVRKGQTVGIVEAMKLMNEIEAERDGVVAEILVTDGQMVEYGQPLVRLAE